MRIVISILATLIIIFSLMQCKKTGDQIVISGYLAMDDNGNYVQGQPYDADDWGSNKSIPSSIEALLKSLPAQFSPASALFNPIIPQGEVSTGVYPNPCNGSFVFHAFLADSSYACSYVVVDAKLHVYQSGSVSGSAQQVNVNIQSLASGLYRVYYIYLDPRMDVLYRGYGDVLKQ
jgi:hypothetical protein